MNKCKLMFFLVLLFIVFGLNNEVVSQAGRFRSLGSKGLGLYDLRKIWNPSWFQGNLRSTDYYEGWYFKIVSENKTHRYAFIPGISLGSDEHAFIQVINGLTGETHYHRFPLDDFSYSRRGFEVMIADNYFSDKGFSVDVGEGKDRIRGEITFPMINEFPVSLFQPGIMGWYRFVPFMETYHGVVSLHHQLEGFLVAGADTLKFDGGPGYVEKDWGSSMPRAWIWMQSNSFPNYQNASFMLSVAHIPWIGRSFTGFLGYLMFEDNFYCFATYTSASIDQVEIDEDKINIMIQDRNLRLIIEGDKGIQGVLMAPVGGVMNRPIHESLDASLNIRLEDNNGNVLFSGQTIQAGLELVGDYELLFP